MKCGEGTEGIDFEFVGFLPLPLLLWLLPFPLLPFFWAASVGLAFRFACFFGSLYTNILPVGELWPSILLWFEYRTIMASRRSV